MASLDLASFPYSNIVLALDAVYAARQLARKNTWGNRSFLNAYVNRLPTESCPLSLKFLFNGKEKNDAEAFHLLQSAMAKAGKHRE